MQIQTKTQIIEIETTIAPGTTIIIKTIDTTAVAISKTTDTTIIAIQQTSNKTETTQINKHVDIVTERITNPEIVKHALIAEGRDTCLANVEHHDKIKTIGIKIRMTTKTRKIINKTATQIPLSNKIL